MWQRFKRFVLVGAQVFFAVMYPGNITDLRSDCEAARRIIVRCAYLNKEEGDAVSLQRSSEGRVLDLGFNLRQIGSLLVLL